LLDGEITSAILPVGERSLNRVSSGAIVEGINHVLAKYGKPTVAT